MKRSEFLLIVVASSLALLIHSRLVHVLLTSSQATGLDGLEQDIGIIVYSVIPAVLVPAVLVFILSPVRRSVNAVVTGWLAFLLILVKFLFLPTL